MEATAAAALAKNDTSLTAAQAEEAAAPHLAKAEDLLAGIAGSLDSAAFTAESTGNYQQLQGAAMQAAQKGELAAQGVPLVC